MEFHSSLISADAESGNVALTLEALGGAGIPIATVTVQFRTALNPSETVQAFRTRAESEARSALQAAANFSVTPHK
ncbi:MAG: hypothetical protein JOZ84_03000 [Methylobacteriaceae bacterium]|nr:hypothetical protein [Methylobacteriaceae bacterium]